MTIRSLSFFLSLSLSFSLSVEFTFDIDIGTRIAIAIAIASVVAGLDARHPLLLLSFTCKLHSFIGSEANTENRS